MISQRDFDLLTEEVRKLRERMEYMLSRKGGYVDGPLLVDGWTFDATSDYTDLGNIRIQWGQATVTPSWNNATSHAWSGPHTITLPASFDSSSFQVVACIHDGVVSNRAAWLTYANPTDAANQFQVYLGAPDPAEADTTNLIIRYVALGVK